LTAGRAERAVLTALLTGIVLAAVLVLTVLGGPTGGELGVRSEALAGAARARLGALGAALPLGYAFAAGMLAALNPCGFALLPAYLGLQLGGRERSPVQRIGRAARFGIVVSATFVLLFGAAGLLVTATGGALVRWFPWAGLLVAVALVVFGAHQLAGGAPPDTGALRAAGRLGGAAARAGVRGSVAYGAAFALTSLGCTLPIFLSVASTSLLGAGAPAAVGQFALYGLGLGTVLTALALGAATAGGGATAVLRGAGRYVEKAGAALLVIGGAFAAFYWLTIGGVLAQALGGG
jgi:cytochrome c-type biogenesis protein